MTAPTKSSVSKPTLSRRFALFLRNLGTKLEPRATGLALANLIAQVGIIVTGGLVRLTGSGLGCSTWPLCEPGQFAPVLHEAATYHPFVEFGNRTMTGVLSVISVLLILALQYNKNRTREVKVLAWTVLVLIAIQAGVGGVTVLFTLNPAIVSAHMLISLALVAVSALLHFRMARSDSPVTAVATPTWLANMGLVQLLLTLPIMVLGVVVTGAGPHSGDTEVGYRLLFDPMSISKLHALFVWLFVVALAVMGAGLLRARRFTDPNGTPLATTAQVNTWWVLVGVTFLQGLIGYYQTFNGLPIFVVLAHMLGAALLTTASVRMTLALSPHVSAWRIESLEASAPR